MGHSDSGESQNDAKVEPIREDPISEREGIVIDEATNKRIVRKIDWRLMPIVCPPHAQPLYTHPPLPRSGPYP